jgi:hypothetical protein
MRDDFTLIGLFDSIEEGAEWVIGAVDEEIRAQRRNGYWVVIDTESIDVTPDEYETRSKA